MESSAQTLKVCLVWLLPPKIQKPNQRAGSSKQLLYKSLFSHSAKPKAILDLLLLAFGWNCENIYQRTFNDF
jgi:hypothetical protein